MDFNKLVNAIKEGSASASIDNWELLGARSEFISTSTFVHEISKVSSTVEEAILLSAYELFNPRVYRRLQRGPQILRSARCSRLLRLHFPRSRNFHQCFPR